MKADDFYADFNFAQDIQNHPNYQVVAVGDKILLKRIDEIRINETNVHKNNILINQSDLIIQTIIVEKICVLTDNVVNKVFVDKPRNHVDDPI